MYANYLVHFNKNHDPKSGRFTFSTGKDLYKSIRKDVRRGEFDPKNYKGNKSIRQAISGSKIVSQIKNRDQLSKEYAQQQREANFKNEIYERKMADRNERAQKYYKEMLNGRDESKLSTDEKYDIFEKAMWKAEDEDFANPRFLDSYNLVDKNKFKNISFEDVSNANLKTAEAYDKIAKTVLGDYTNKSISMLKSDNRAREYVNSIVDEILFDKNVKIRT